jgi:hypothetical protein
MEKQNERVGAQEYLNLLRFKIIPLLEKKLAGLALNKAEEGEFNAYVKLNSKMFDLIKL